MATLIGMAILLISGASFHWLPENPFEYSTKFGFIIIFGYIVSLAGIIFGIAQTIYGLIKEL